MGACLIGKNRKEKLKEMEKNNEERRRKKKRETQDSK